MDQRTQPSPLDLQRASPLTLKSAGWLDAAEYGGPFAYLECCLGWEYLDHRDVRRLMVWLGEWLDANPCMEEEPRGAAE